MRRWDEITSDFEMWDRYEDEVDVAIVGGGPAGLAAAIRLRQMADEAGLDEEFRICVIEKAANIGDHTLSGACLETRALDELLPNWKEMGAPLHTEVKVNHFSIFSDLFQIFASILRFFSIFCLIGHASAVARKFLSMC